MKGFRVIIAIGLIAICGLSCTKYVGPNEKYTIEDITGSSSISTNELVVSSNTTVSHGGITATPIFDEVPGAPKDRNWISPGKVFVNGIYPGGRAAYFVKVHNGKDKGSIFSIVCRYPDQLEKGYKNLPLHWVYIANGSPFINAGETVTIPIYVEIPLGYKGSYQEKLECLIGVVDKGRGGNIIIELCSKWLVTTK